MYLNIELYNSTNYYMTNTTYYYLTLLRKFEYKIQYFRIYIYIYLNFFILIKNVYALGL